MEKDGKITVNLNDCGGVGEPCGQVHGDVLVVLLRLEEKPYVSEKVKDGEVKESKGAIVVSTHGFKEIEGAEYKGMPIRFSGTGTVPKPHKDGDKTTTGTTKKFVEF